MRTAILVHGMPSREEYYDPERPSASNAHWFPWLQNQLLARGIAAATPEMPLAYAPDYDVWRREFERFDVDSGTILVGHSCGGGFLLRWLSEHPEVLPDTVVLVAPWLDPHREDTTDFFAFTIDPQLSSRTRLTVFASDDDIPSVTESVAMLRGAVPDLEYREFHRYGHFCREDLGTDAFPELLDAVLPMTGASR